MIHVHENEFFCECEQKQIEKKNRVRLTETGGASIAGEQNAHHRI
jgi:hypothetical protein